MSAIRGRYQDGKVILDVPTDWPEGIEVQVEPMAERQRIGLSEDEWDDSPEGVAAWIAWANSLEPFLSSEEDEIRRQALTEQKVWQLAQAEERFRKIQSLFE